MVVCATASCGTIARGSPMKHVLQILRERQYNQSLDCTYALREVWIYGNP